MIYSLCRHLPGPKLRRLATSLVLIAAAASCTSIDFEKLQPGSFSGTLIVMWVGPGASSGDGKFVFVPDPHDRLTFIRPGGKENPIVPGVMYTDGGSVPRAVQVFRGFNPWGYAPAYMVHDWIFTAHHCLVDGRKDPVYVAVSDIGFDESGVILGEAIWTLMKEKLVIRDDVVAGAITTAVRSPFAKKIWDGSPGACENSAVTEDHLREIERAVPGSTVDEARRRHLDIAGAIRSFRRASNAVEVGRVTF
ncbi:hypothetical protein ACVJBD_002232 [Rhizobium mongolense]